MTKASRQTILLVEDTLPVAHLYEACLQRENYAVFLAENGKQALEFLDRTLPSAIVLDLMLPDTNGMEILQHAHKRYPELPVIVVTATNSINVAVEAMRRGAFDFIVKPVSSARLITTVRNALERKALVEEVAEFRQVMGQGRFQDFVGQSASMQAIYRIIDSVAPSKASVLIRGENGTGKELAAQAIHNASPRRLKPFFVLDCAAMSQNRIDDHQFDRIQQANGGTLFLDEVCAMPLEPQARLLQFLQTGEIIPSGRSKTEIVDVRIIAATGRDALEQVRAGGMREDLYYRLNVIPLEMPPLREREDDVMMLAQHFLAKSNAEESKSFAGFDPEVMSLFRRFDWAGNVRQLENVVRNVAVLHSGEIVTASMLPDDLQRFAEKSLWPAANENSQELLLTDAAPRDAIKPLWLAEREIIAQALDFTNQNIAQAAALLQIGPSALYRKIQAWKADGKEVA